VIVAQTQLGLTRAWLGIVALAWARFANNNYSCPNISAPVDEHDLLLVFKMISRRTCTTSMVVQFYDLWMFQIFQFDKVILELLAKDVPDEKFKTESAENDTNE
jgi:hypothetical protein